MQKMDNYTQNRNFTSEQVFSKIAQNQSDETIEWNEKEFVKKRGKTGDQNNILLELLLNSV